MIRMPTIDSLTSEQEALLDVYAEKWIAIGLDATPADRPRAEAAIARVYTAGGLRPPGEIVWCQSPDDLITTAKKRGDTVAVGDFIFGQHDAGWLSFYAYMREVVGLVEETEELMGLLELAQSAGWAAVLENVCYVSERPSVMRLDIEGRLHSLAGAAIQYPDGWGVYAVHGTVVPDEWILHPEQLTPDMAFRERNMERRRAVIDILGWERILAALPTKEIDVNKDPQIGTLLSVDLPDEPGSRFLRVLCGTGRTFVLAVPREMKTAREANAWTYQIPPEMLDRYEVRT